MCSCIDGFRSLASYILISWNALTPLIQGAIRMRKTAVAPKSSAAHKPNWVTFILSSFQLFAGIQSGCQLFANSFGDPPAFNDVPSLPHTREPVRVKTPIAQFAVERFDVPILHGLPGFDVVEADAPYRIWDVATTELRLLGQQAPTQTAIAFSLSSTMFGNA
jgi:hypothetical protein